MVSCATCQHFLSKRCQACVRGNSSAARTHHDTCAIYDCVKSQGIESCRQCRAATCAILESGEPFECGLAEHFAGKRGGTSLVKALADLKSVRHPGATGDLPPRLLRRLPAYLMAVQELAREGVEYVVSAELALRIGTSAALVRKDLSGIGHWGRRSAGYRVTVLSDELRCAAGLGEPRHAAWLGCERLQRYPRVIDEFRVAGCVISAAFCYDGKHVGQEVQGLIVKPMQEFALVSRSLGLSLAVIAVEDDHAQGAAEAVAAAGVRSMLNLTDKMLIQPRGTIVENVIPLQGLVTLLLRTPSSGEAAKTIAVGENGFS